jgi:lipoprotein NlpD
MSGKRQRCIPRWIALAVLLVPLLAGTGCFRSESVREVAPPAPSQAEVPRYQVQRGDTLYGIARKHGLRFPDLARWNGIGPPYTIYPRQQLLLGPPAQARSAQAPSSGKPTSPSRSSQARTAPLRDGPAPTPAKPATPPRPTASAAGNAAAAGTAAAGTAASAPAPSTAAAASSKPSAGGWRWPTEGNVIRGFVANDPGRQGIKIAGEAGQPVIASRAGQVVYSGAGLVGYGELVIIKHDGGYLTAYGHNRRRLVQEGEQVKAGQTIAELGRSGTDREMLHFEIRVGGKPVDPLPLLPR